MLNRSSDLFRKQRKQIWQQNDQLQMRNIEMMVKKLSWRSLPCFVVFLKVFRGGIQFIVFERRVSRFYGCFFFIDEAISLFRQNFSEVKKLIYHKSKVTEISQSDFVRKLYFLLLLE